MPVDPNNTDKVVVEIMSGQAFKDICKDLETKKLVKHWWALDLISRIKKQHQQIKAGEYELSPSMTPKEILAKFVSGDVLRRMVTLKEGSTIKDIGAALEKAGLVSQAEFEVAATDATLLSLAGINSQSFEGYLFPETYAFVRPADLKHIIWTLLEQGERNWPKEYTARADELGLSRHEILTLASIIEKESGNVDEQPMVSSVFHNRLSKGMKLQSDPTVIYGLKDFNGNLTRADLDNPHTYNTYAHFGLPPGPIANPGKTAIRAALYPAKSEYLYFVADGNGSHIFSATLQEHNEAVNKYQRNLNAGAALILSQASSASSSSASSSISTKSASSKARK